MISPDGRTAIPEPAGTPLIALFSQMGHALLTSESLDSMLKKVLDLVFENLPAQRGCIYLYDAPTDSLTEKATRREDDRDPIKISRSIVSEVIKAKKALLIRDVRMHPMRSYGLPSRGWPIANLSWRARPVLIVGPR